MSTGLVSGVTGLRAVGLALLVALAGCADREPLPETPQQGVLAFDARVVRVSLEGGFYGLISDGDVRFEPLNLAPSYQRDGLRLRVRAEPADVASIRMWGRPIRILDVQVLQ